MKECDVIIPVYKSPEWVELCLYALFQNTNETILNRVYLINDSDDEFTKNCLRNLKAKYGDKITIKQNEKNMGFTGTANRGLRLSTADYVLLLNTDCLVSKNTVEKLITHMKTDDNIGLICPISSNAANLSLDILEGFTYMQMNEILEKRFSGMLFDACTVVGNCLMISRKCIEKVGVLDEVYAPGYGEETDYQFKAMEEGFSAKVAIDTYVFHKSETSFGVSDAKKRMIDDHLAIFFSRWGDEYYKELKKYNKHDPVKFILNDFKSNPPEIKNSAMFYVMNINSGGGCNVIVDIINRLAINGYQCNILYDRISAYPETMLFKPVSVDRIDDIHAKRIVATLWATVFLAKKIAERKKWELLYFVQGLEQHFEDGRNYGSVEVSYKIPKSIIVVSEPLKKWLHDICGIDSYLIRNGINLELLKKERVCKKINTILLVTRNDYLKCSHVLFDILRKIDVKMSNFLVNVVVASDDFVLPVLYNKSNRYNIIKGPLERNKIYELMQESDIYIDASYSEGFGLTALESMAAGCIPIASDSFGVRDYLRDSENGLLVKSVNDADAYLEKVEVLINHEDLRQEIYANMEQTVEDYDFNNRVQEYAKAFCGRINTLGVASGAPLKMRERQIYKKVLAAFAPPKKVMAPCPPRVYSKWQRFVRKIVKILPKAIRCLGVRIVEFLRSCY